MYTPRGTRVEVQVDAAERCVQVCDRWPGDGGGMPGTADPPALGLGLGHRVIAKIAEIHGARFQPWDESRGSAHRYRIVFR